MGDIVNLNKFRKKKNKDQSAQKASENRILFGRTKNDKAADKREKKKTQSDLDNKKLNKNKPIDNDLK